MRALETLIVVAGAGAISWWIYNQLAARLQVAAAPAGASSGTVPPAGSSAVISTSTSTSSSSSSRYDLANQAAAAAGVDQSVFYDLVTAESAWNPNAVSSAGAIGLTQLMPATAAQLGVSNPYDPWQNLVGGATYLASLLNQFGGDYWKALAAYNAGPGNVSKAVAAAGGAGADLVSWFNQLGNYQSLSNHIATAAYVSSIMANSDLI
jgi:soluble lytic murein transglycosylase-like protein